MKRKQKRKKMNLKDDNYKNTEKKFKIKSEEYYKKEYINLYPFNHQFNYGEYLKVRVQKDRQKGNFFLKDFFFSTLFLK